AGRTFVLTGTLAGMTREAAQEALVARGAKVSGRVSKKTSYLVAGADARSELEKGGAPGGTGIGEEEARRRRAEGRSRGGRAAGRGGGGRGTQCTSAAARAALTSSRSCRPAGWPASRRRPERRRPERRRRPHPRRPEQPGPAASGRRASGRASRPWRPSSGHR